MRLALFLSTLFVAGVPFLGCSGPTTCKHLGEGCGNLDFCCVPEGLLCQPTNRGSVCAKSCRCHGTTLCTPTSFDEGCPQGSACLATESDGQGECVPLCNKAPCPTGTWQCGSTLDGGAITCAAVDGGAADLGASDLGARPD